MADLKTARKPKSPEEYAALENAAMVRDSPNRFTPLSVEDCADVLAFIRENGPLTVNAIAEKNRRARSWALNRIMVLEKHGTVIRRLCNDKGGQGRNHKYYLIEAVVP